MGSLWEVIDGAQKCGRGKNFYSPTFSLVLVNFLKTSQTLRDRLGASLGIYVFNFQHDVIDLSRLEITLGLTCYISHSV